MRRFFVAFCVFAAGAGNVSAQWVVHDAAATARNSVTAMVKEYLLDTQRQQHERIRRMAERLSVYTDIRKYATPNPPAWERTNPRPPLYAAAFDSSLTSGDVVGVGYLNVAQSILAIPRRALWAPSAARVLEARLATVDVADAANILAADSIGSVRSAGHDREMAAIAALELHVTDPSPTQSATAVLDKIGGAGLISARQRQARVRLLTGVVDSKRARDTEAAAANMQIVTWLDAAQAERAFRAGTGDALRTWRQP